MRCAGGGGFRRHQRIAGRGYRASGLDEIGDDSVDGAGQLHCEARGVAIVRTLRQLGGFTAPIVVFSGTVAHAEEVRQLAALGVCDYINEYSAMQHISRALEPHVNQIGRAHV